MNILITSAGRRVSLVQSFQKELKNIFPEGKVFTVDSSPESSAACRISDGFFKIPRIDDPNFISFLKNLCIKLDVKLIIPTIDTELLILSQNKKLFLEHNIQILVSSTDFISKCRYKRKTQAFFQERSINVAKEFSKTDYKLPLFIKPCDGSGSIDNFIIRHKKEITSYHLCNEKLMFLEYIDQNKYDEFTCDLYYDKNSNLKCVVPRKRISIRSGEVEKGLTLKNNLVTLIKESLENIDGVIGCINIQLFLEKDGDKVYGIEINPRFGGGYPLSYLAGANYTKWIIEE